MLTVSVEEAQADLRSLIERLSQGEEIVITQDQQSVAHLVPASPSVPHPVFGSCRGKLTIVSDDDEHLADFALATGAPTSSAGGSTDRAGVVRGWLEEVRRLHEQIVSRHGILPDSTPLIAGDRLRGG